jgi:hypothetical protein
LPKDASFGSLEDSCRGTKEHAKEKVRGSDGHQDGRRAVEVSAARGATAGHSWTQNPEGKAEENEAEDRIMLSEDGHLRKEGTECAFLLPH